MKTMLVLAMHGAPPSDFPRHELMELMGLHERLKDEQHSDPLLRQRYEALDARMRSWPRTAGNDPFFGASTEMGRCLGERMGLEVLVGFNEFCAPTIGEALEAAVQAGAEQVVVVTPMLTRGGEHAEYEIPETIAACQARHPEVDFRYAWPFDACRVSDFLAAQVETALAERQPARGDGG
jgi:sirohydrochlorin cobaltochelatase